MFTSIVSCSNGNSPPAVALERHAWKRPKRELHDRYRLRLVPLESRLAPTCGPGDPPDDPPWCFDAGFDTDGHAIVDIAGRLEEARAMTIQSAEVSPGVDIELPIVGGWARSRNPDDQEGPNFALARYCPDGRLDSIATPNNCTASGFGEGGRGTKIINFWNNTSTQPGELAERIEAIAIQRNIHSDVCDGPKPSVTSDRIIVAG
jgi:hypothetical protein